MGNALNVAVGKPKPTGAVFAAPAGTALPTDATTALAVAYVDHGYVSSDGMSRSISRAFSEIKEWGGKTVKRPQTESGVEVTLALIEGTGLVAKAVFGEANVTITPATSTTGTLVEVAFNGEELPIGVWAFDLVDSGTKAIRRIVLPAAQVTNEDFEQTYSGESEIQYPLTLTCFPDEAGNYFYEYADDGVFSA